MNKMLVQEVINKLNKLSEKDKQKPLSLVLLDKDGNFVTQVVYGLVDEVTSTTFSVELKGTIVSLEE
jgi:hypothetical protein